MRKLLSIMFLLVIGTCAFAQKKYLSVYLPHHISERIDSRTAIFARMGGDIPADMSTELLYGDFLEMKEYEYVYNPQAIGVFINLLIEKGYTLENTIALPNANGESRLLLLFSRGSSNPINGVQRVAADPDEDVVEIARYNLQGMPINESEKGIQIIVYSNYTTKTIIKE